MIVNQNIVSLRKWANLSRRQFALKIKVSPQTIDNIENGHDFKAYTLYKLLKVYPKLDLNWLLFNKGEMFETNNPTLVREQEQIYTTECKTRIAELNRTIDILERENILLHKIVNKN